MFDVQCLICVALIIMFICDTNHRFSLKFWWAVFQHAYAFNADVSKWDVRAVVNTDRMFEHATLFGHIWCDEVWFKRITEADFSDSSGKVLCCPTGKYYNASEATCGFCASGQYNGVLELDKQLPLSCVDCPRNTFAPIQGLPGCSDCESDQYRYYFFFSMVSFIL